MAPNQQVIYLRKCRDFAEVENKMKKVEHDEGRIRLQSFKANTKTALTMMILAAVLVNVLGDDTQAFRDTLSSLCSLNKQGKFGSCCGSFNINSVTLSSSPARNCFVSYLGSSSGSVVTILFVFFAFKCLMVAF